MNFVLKPWKVGGEVLELLETVYHLANSAKVNSKNCKKAAGRIKAWEHFVKNCMKEYQKTDDGETHVTKYPYVGATCVAQVSSSSQ